MDITVLPKNGLKIKGKSSYFLVDPSGKQTQDRSEPSAVIALAIPIADLSVPNNAVVVNGPGDYEIGGIKMSATRSEGEIIFNPKVDGVDIILGKLSSLEKLQHKLKDQNIVIAYVDSVINASFITSLSSNVVIFYGDNAEEAAKSFGKENISKMPKYSVTLDKLPQEVETVILE